MRTVVIKVVIESVTNRKDGSKSIQASPVINGSEENKEFFKWTPSGNIEFFCLNPEVDMKPGEEYFVEFRKS